MRGIYRTRLKDKKQEKSMKKTIFAALFAIALTLPLPSLADSYTSLWKQYDTAVKKDLPRSELKVLDTIIKRATREKAYGHLLKAQLASVSAMASIAPDSLTVAIARLKTAETTAATSNGVLAAVYQSVLGTAYAQNPSLDDNGETLSKEYFKKSMSHPKALASTLATGYEPFVIDGVDSRYFGDDLLHIIGMAAGDYQGMHDYYDKNGNREAACLTALELENTKRDSSTTRLKKSKYVLALDSLIKEYGDLTVAGEVAIARFTFMNDCAEDVTAEEKMNYINYALTKWGAWPRMNILRNAQRKLTLPMFHASLGNELMMPGEKRKVIVMELCNIGELKMTVSRLDLDGTTTLNPSDAKDYEKLRRHIIQSETPVTLSKRYIGNANYKVLRDTLEIDRLPKGTYLIELSTDNISIPTERALLRVSDLYPVSEALPGKKTRMAVLSATTGEPVAGAHADIIFYDRSGNEKVETYTCDENGEVTFDNTIGDPIRCRVYTDTDRAFPQSALHSYFSYYASKGQYDDARIYTDRRIYRPGQTVHVAAIVYNYDNAAHKAEAVNGRQIKMSLRDANNKEVATQTVTTDEFGTASADFAIPQKGLCGRYTVRANYGQTRYATFSVEEYKRPTFFVEFDKQEKAYQDGDTVAVTGNAKSFAGIPIQGARVAIKATRRPALWWRYATNVAKSEQVFCDTITTDADGKFTANVPLTLPATSDSHPKRYYMFDISADITDGTGETRHGETSVPLSDTPTIFTCNLPERILRDSLKTITFSYKNNAGLPIEGNVTYIINNTIKTCKANEPVKIDASQLVSARHTLVAYCGNDTISRSFVTFTMHDKRTPIETHDWFYQSAEEFPANGSPVYIQVGSSDNVQHIMYTMISGDKIIENGTSDLHNELSTKAITYKEEYGDGVVLSLVWVKNGIAYKHTARIKRPQPDRNLKLAWTTFRDRLTPGQKETWVLKITGNDGKPAKAQLLATMYDKSLDEIMPHSINFSLSDNLSMPSLTWNGIRTSNMTMYGEMPVKFLNDNQLDFSHFFMPNISALSQIFYTISDRVGGMAKPMYTRANRALAANVLMAKQQSEAAKYNGAVMESVEELSSVSQTTKEEFDDAEASDASKTDTGSKQIQVRENLDETAFFYPALLADGNGNVSMKFTLPESVTTWQVYGLAHDAAMNYGTLSATAIAAKTVMIQPNMPRFLRTEDSGTISARITNSSAKTVNGTAKLSFIDAETNREVYSQERKYTVNANATSTVDFSFDMSKINNNGMLICRTTASGHGYSDGEQHYLPVLPDREMVTNTLPFTINEKGTATFNVENLFKQNGEDNKLTIEYADNPAWMMIQALPSVANANEENAVSLATAYYANSLGRHIMQSSPAIKQVISLWKNNGNDANSLQSCLESNQELKSLVLEETPWLAEASRETEQMQMLSTFFDESTIDYRLDNYIGKLRNLQNADGSFSWWKGMKGNPYITTSVLKLLTRLNNMVGEQQQTSDIMLSAFAYTAQAAGTAVKEMKEKNAKGESTPYVNDALLDYLYVCAIGERKLTAKQKEDVDYLVNILANQSAAYSIYEKARASIVLAKFGHKAEASTYLQSIKEHTVYKEDMGRYFDTDKATYSWCDYRIPTQTAAIEALQLLDSNADNTVNEMRRWLLQSKRTQAWDTPLNSVDAIYAFLNGNAAAISEVNTPSAKISIDGKKANMPKATSGLGYAKTVRSGNKFKTVTVEKLSDNTSWGAVYAQFLQPTKDVEASSAGMSITREVMKDGKRLTDETTKLKVGDMITVRITITAERDYDFVQVVDKRAACMEQARQTSGYAGGYYCSPKDNSTVYCFDRLAKGKHVIETCYSIDRTGTYSTGTCTAQCAYSPAHSARTAAKTFTISK